MSKRTAVIGLAALIAVGVGWILPLAVVELFFWSGDGWAGCSSASVNLALSGPSRLLAAGLAFAASVGGIAVLVRTRWKFACIPLFVGAVWLLSTNYLALVYNLCSGTQVHDMVATMRGDGPLADFREDPGGPIDPTGAGLPLSVPLGEPACWHASGRALTVYRVGAEPLEFTAPLLRWWPTEAEGVANVFSGQRTVWVCGQDAPKAVFQQLARQAGHDPGQVVVRAEPDGTTRGEVPH